MGTLSDIASILDRAEAAARYGSALKTSKTGSLARFTKAARVEPLCVVDSDCIQLEYMPDLVQCLQSIFTAYYLQAVSLLGTVANVSVMKDLDKLNPNRDPETATTLYNIFRDHLDKKIASIAGAMAPESFYLSQENYEWDLPSSGINLSLEYDKNRNNNKGKNNNNNNRDKNNRDRYDRNEKKPPGRYIEENKGLTSTVQDISNLSVGKIFEVKIVKNNQEVTVPITIRLLVNEIPVSNVLEMFGKAPMDDSFVERFYKWKAGRISLFGDLIMCRDMIREYKRNLAKDDDKVFTEVNRRANNNVLAGILSNNPSLATSSNLYVISKETASAIKRSSGLDITKYNQRQEIFEKTYAMVICVVDRDYERVTFYHDGITMPTDMGVRDLRVANKNTGPTIMDVLSAYRQGQAPTL